MKPRLKLHLDGRFSVVQVGAADGERLAPQMHPADIKAALAKAGFTQVQLARTVRGRHGKNVTHSAVHHTIHGIGKSLPIALRISEVTGLSLDELWPGQYSSATCSDRIDPAHIKTRSRKTA